MAQTTLPDYTESYNSASPPTPEPDIWGSTLKLELLCPGPQMYLCVLSTVVVP